MSTSKPKAQEPLQTPDDRLDEALNETFPASDPIAIHPDEDDALPSEPESKPKKPR